MGTANRGQEQPFTKLEAGEEADKLPPFYIGYYQGSHYQSLEKIDEEEEYANHQLQSMVKKVAIGIDLG